MGLFDMFRSRKNRQADEALEGVFAKLFPNGEKDVLRDCGRVNQLTHGKMPHDKLRGFVAGCKGLIALSRAVRRVDDEEKFIASFVQSSEGRISMEEALEVYVYLSGEAAYLDTVSLAVNSSGATVPPEVQKHLEELPEIFASGVTTDAIPGGYGEFGLVASNPVPTVSISASEGYLRRLRFDGKPVESSRLGSTVSEVTSGNVDLYQLSLGDKVVGTVYVCPYHKRNSRKAPRGFTLAEVT